MTVPDSTALENALLAALVRAGDGKTLSPPEIAHAIAQTMSPATDWHALLVPLRRAAVALAQNGQIVIYRKGKPVDPTDFKGVYRLGLPRHD